MKDFAKDFTKFRDFVKKREPFALGRYGDGEYGILRNKETRVGDKWHFKPGRDHKAFSLLQAAFRCGLKNYYVGIPCPCCMPQHVFDWCCQNTRVPEEQLTWANIFVNKNYPRFRSELLPLFSSYEIIMVGNDKTRVSDLPFEVEKFYPIGVGKWMQHLELVDVLKKRRDSGKLYLFAAGVLANILVHQLWESNPKNIYLDIGSTLNEWSVGKDRKYLQGRKTLSRHCVWGK